ncbi:phage tail protein [Serratia marcescens]|uniref:Phage tail protein n=1 Tax=Serratia marcescens TaxID=615 RepID=A0A5C7C8U5_SERMA|nr:phage tail protein [Serratia marcescens]TXE33249.1 phage tail protein [Serratia marcescens]TXE65227.1 phage tail protein [Serratia marcescens]
MLKPALLRKTLMDAVPQFRNDPDKLKLYIEHGNVISTLAPSLSHEHQYTLAVTIINFSGSVNAVFVPILSWLRCHQPDGMSNPDMRQDAFTYEIDILNNEACDIEITLKLTERTVVSEDDTGNLNARDVGEPPSPYDRHGPFHMEGVNGSEWTV